MCHHRLVERREKGEEDGSGDLSRRGPGGHSSPTLPLPAASRLLAVPTGVRRRYVPRFFVSLLN